MSTWQQSIVDECKSLASLVFGSLAYLFCDAFFSDFSFSAVCNSGCVLRHVCLAFESRIWSKCLFHTLPLSVETSYVSLILLVRLSIYRDYSDRVQSHCLRCGTHELLLSFRKHFAWFSFQRFSLCPVVLNQDTFSNSSHEIILLEFHLWYCWSTF